MISVLALSVFAVSRFGVSGFAAAWATYLLNALWQVPLILFVALLLARLVRPLGPAGEHRVWVGTFLAEIVLPAVHLRSSGWLHWPITATSSDGVVGVALGPAVYSGVRSQFGGTVLVAVTVLSAGWLLYATLRLLWGLWRVHTLAREARPLVLTGDAAGTWEQACSQIQRQRRPALATSPHVFGPVTLGVFRPMLLLPDGFVAALSTAELRVTFAHELAHCARADVARQLLYSVLALPLGWHPALRATERQVAATRELLCDAVAAPAVGGPKPYARSLLRIAAALGGPNPVAGIAAIGFLDSSSFERRIMSLAQFRPTVSRTHRLLVIATAALAAALTCSSAVALRIEPPAPPLAATAERPHVPASVMTGNKISGATPEYPAEARQKKIEGKVTLGLTINEQGEPEDIHVVNSPSSLLTDSAITAVRTWRWKPYTVDSQPVSVDTTVNVTYSLAG